MIFVLATIFLATGQQISESTNIPAGASIGVIGKVRPGSYVAMRDYRSLPKIGELSAEKRTSFTGMIITLDSPSIGMIHVLNYRNGKRVVLDQKNGPKVNGVPLTKMLSTLLKNTDVRFAGGNGAGFDVKLPGGEASLKNFIGTLTGFATKTSPKKILIRVKNGKVVSSEYVKPPAIPRANG